MDRFLSPAMPPKTPRVRSERRPQEAKMAAASAASSASSLCAVDADQALGSQVQTPLPTETVNFSSGIPPSGLGSDGAKAPQSFDTAINPMMESCAFETSATYSAMVKAVQDAMAPLIAQQAATLQQAVKDIKEQLSSLSGRIISNECRIGENLQDIQQLKQDFTVMRKAHLQMSNKLIDLENRSRRCNLRIVGLSEEVKGPDLFKFLQKTLPELLHIPEACADMIIERAHRLGPPRNSADPKPRVVIFKILSFIHKEAIWAASWRLKDLSWNGSRLMIFQDYSAEVAKARKEFSGLCSRLVKDNVKFALLYQARLRLFDGSSYKDFSTVGDAESYLRELGEELQQAPGCSSPPPRSPP